MTSVTKQYVDFSDLIAVVVTCKNCRAALVLPLGGTNDQLANGCPSCKAMWYMPLPEATIGSRWTAFNNAIGRLSQMLSDQSESLQITMQIELKSAPKIPASS